MAVQVSPQIHLQVHTARDHLLVYAKAITVNRPNTCPVMSANWNGEFEFIVVVISAPTVQYRRHVVFSFNPQELAVNAVCPVCVHISAKTNCNQVACRKKQIRSANSTVVVVHQRLQVMSLFVLVAAHVQNSLAHGV